MDYIAHILLSLFFWCATFFIRKDEFSIVLGSWKGESFSDNTRYLAEYIGTYYPQYKLFWVGKEKIRSDIENAAVKMTFLEMGKLRTVFQIMKCRYCFVSQKYDVDICKYNIHRNMIICYLHHGTPVKKLGDDGLNMRKSKFDKLKLGAIADTLTARNIQYDYFASSSPLNSAVFCSAFKSAGCTTDKILPCGTPRNDMLVKNEYKKVQRFRTYYCEKLGISKDKTIIMYLPTFRRRTDNMFSFASLSGEQYEAINHILREQNAVIIEKSHFVTSDTKEKPTLDRICFADKTVNVQEMLMMTDILISDYSGAFLDFSILDRPIIHFAYDYEYYKNSDSGLYYSIEEFAAGSIVYTFDELCEQLSAVLNGDDSYREKRRHVRERFMEYERGKASEEIFRQVVLGRGK